jgi:uncharacterized protein YjbJ (UPF0337 family)
MPKEASPMAQARNKARNTAQSAKGKVKEAAGKATGNRKLETKGKTDQGKASVKKTGEKVKDKLR